MKEPEKTEDEILAFSTEQNSATKLAEANFTFTPPRNPAQLSQWFSVALGMADAEGRKFVAERDFQNAADYMGFAWDRKY